MLSGKKGCYFAIILYLGTVTYLIFFVSFLYQDKKEKKLNDSSNLEHHLRLFYKSSERNKTHKKYLRPGFMRRQQQSYGHR